jgi:hypothetical protein
MSYIPIEGFYHDSEPAPHRSAVEVMRGWVSSFIMPAEAPLCMSEHAGSSQQPAQTAQVEHAKG